VGVVWEITELYCRKGITSKISARWNGGATCMRKGKDFILGPSNIVFSLEVGRKSVFLLFPMAFGPARAGQALAYTYVNSQVLQTHEKRKFPL
jgi:hypothetical protein